MILECDFLFPARGPFKYSGPLTGFKPRFVSVGNQSIQSTQKNITYTGRFEGEFISRKITYLYADLPLIRINF